MGEGGGGVVQNKKPSMGKYEYFLELHMIVMCLNREV